MALNVGGAGTHAAASGASPATITTDSLVPFNAGDFMMVVMAYDNSGGGGADPMSGTITVSPATGALAAASSAQTGLNDPGAASAGLAVRAVLYKVNTTIPGGTVLTISWSGTVAVRAITCSRIYSDIAGATINYRTNSGSTGTNVVNSATVAFTTPSVNTNEMVMCWAGCEYGTLITADADTTNGTWKAIDRAVTGSTTSGMGVATQAKVVTATGTQSWDPSMGAATDWIVGCVILTEVPPAATVTQASYRVYADGSETGSTALAAQDTAPTISLDAGDVIVNMRVRLQSTNAGDQAAGDDYQLQWEENASGTWTTVANLLGRLDAVNSSVAFGSGATVVGHGHSFQGQGGKLTKARFWVYRVGNPTYNLSAQLFAHTGTYGTNGTGTGSALATSDSIAASTITTNTYGQLVEFTFDGTVTLTNATPYVILLVPSGGGDASNKLQISTPVNTTHPGNSSTLTMPSTWTSAVPNILFEVVAAGGTNDPVQPSYSGGGSTMAHNSVTTNRLGAGTGSFMAGEVVVTGDAGNVLITANNYTEFDYVFVLRAEQLVNGDTLRFRVRRNGATTGLTYSVTPTINITKIANWPATIATNWGSWSATATGTITTPITVSGFRFYNDDATFASSTALGGSNVNIKLADADKNVQFRVQIGNTDAASASQTFYLQRNINGGAWAFMSATTGITSADSPNYGNGAAVTAPRVAGGVGTFGNGEACDGVGNYATTPTIPANGYTECVYTIKLIAADVVGGDVLGLRLTNASAAPISTALTVQITVAADIAATVTTNWGGWSATASAVRDTAATITTSWGTWSTTVTAKVEHLATVADNWGGWTATASAAPSKVATIATNWGSWTATATAQPIERNATITSAWGAWTATGIALIERYGTITSSWGVWTATATGTVVPSLAWGIPQNVVATATGQTTITVTWNAVPAATGYDIERNGTVIVLDHPASPFNDTVLTPDTAYNYRVRAVG